MTTRRIAVYTGLALLVSGLLALRTPFSLFALETHPAKTVRIAAAQPRDRTIDWKLGDPAEVLRRVDESLAELEGLIRKAGSAKCDAIVFPEDTAGLLKWEAAHPDRVKDVLPAAVRRMLDRLGGVAGEQRMFLVVCSDTLEADGALRNTAFLLGRDGRELGRYHKVNLTLSEQSRARGDRFPVFRTEDLGDVGMLICYDMVFPEAARCLALAGADVVMVPTLGGAAIGDEDISLAAFRTRAVDNFVYLVVSMRGRGSMIISPQGKVIAEAMEADGLAIADIDPRGGREGGDAFNTQSDMRGRLFRERVPGAYGILTDPQPPVLAKVASNVTKEEAVRIAAVALTSGEERFKEAEGLARAGRTEEAIRLFEKLCEECRTSWVDRAGRERLDRLRAKSPDGNLRLERHSGPFNFGLQVTAPWPDGGRLLINLPEHLEYESNGLGILRHNDKERRGAWQVAQDGRSAALDAESPTARGVRVTGSAHITGAGRVELVMRVTNGGATPLSRVKPLYCFQYAGLSGFPGKPNGLEHVHAVVGGKIAALASGATRDAASIRKGGTVIGCPQADDAFLENHGGRIETGVDCALAAATALDGRRKVVVAWRPGKSVLANGNIPCLHGDPFYGTVAPGQAAEAHGVLLFTESPLEEAIAGLRAEGWGAPGPAASTPQGASPGATPEQKNFSAGADTARRFGTHEVVLSGNDSSANPFDTTVTVKFTPPSRDPNAVAVHAFYDGGRTWRARVFVTEAGRWTWSSACGADRGLDGQAGAFTAVDSDLRGMLRKHRENPRAWTTDDGRPFVNLSDTAYRLFHEKDAPDWQQFVRDSAAKGVTCIRAAALGGWGGTPQARVDDNNTWVWNDPWAGGAAPDYARFDLGKFQNTDRRLIWLLDIYPDLSLQFILLSFKGYGGEGTGKFWASLPQTVRANTLRYMIARWSAFPNLFWLIVNDMHSSERFPLNQAFVREVGMFFAANDPWKHLISTGPNRGAGFAFTTEQDLKWCSYIHIEDANAVGAEVIQKYKLDSVPLHVWMAEDHYEHDHGVYADPRFFFRWLFWSWLLSGGSANYCGRWGPIHPYSQTGRDDLAWKGAGGLTYTGQQLKGLDSVPHIGRYFKERDIDLGYFLPNDGRVSDLDGRSGRRRPKLMERGNDEFLIYHPNASADGKDAYVDPTKTARLRIDLTGAAGSFEVEWFRAYDGVATEGAPVAGGGVRELAAPWQGYDVVARLSRSKRG